MIDVGDRAPDFTLPASTGGDLTLGSFAGRKNVLLVFYPLAFTPVCTSELSGLEGNAAIFDRLDTQMVALSVDSVHSARAFAKKIGIRSFSLLGDLNKEVCRLYGVLRQEGFAERATFLIDRKGMVRYRATSPLDTERSIADYLQAIEAL